MDILKSNMPILLSPISAGPTSKGKFGPLFSHVYGQFKNEDGGETLGTFLKSFTPTSF